MFSSIKLDSFGSFKSFDLANQYRDGQRIEFSKLNIIYGRNYSGKTTLSRAFRSIETGELPKHFSDPRFELITDTVTINESLSNTDDISVRVYNDDFIKEHLGFLKNEDDGTISIFTVLGKDNTSIEKEIDSIKQKLGSIENKSGLYYQLEQAKGLYEDKLEVLNNLKYDLEGKIKNHANKVIKQNSLYGNPNYFAPRLKSDITHVIEHKTKPLPEDEAKQLALTIDEEQIDDIKHPSFNKLEYEQIELKANQLLSKRIRPTQAITDLLEDELIGAWAKQGIPLHRDKRNTCGFCGQTLPNDLWTKLDDHFSKESSDLEIEINLLLDDIDDEYDSVNEYLNYKDIPIYQSVLDTDKSIVEDLEYEINTYKHNLENLKSFLKKRKAHIYKTINNPDMEYTSENLSQILTRFRSLIDAHNTKNRNIKKLKTRAKRALLLDNVRQFAQTIDYVGTTSRIAELSVLTNTANLKFNDLLKQVNDYVRKIDELNIQRSDERAAAEAVNELLASHFGHKELRLDVFEGKSIFSIYRNKVLAFDLSEGERNLIAFCYFIARLKDSQSENKKHTVYIDDPVSSLDNNHIYYVFSLINSEITKTKLLANVGKEYIYDQIFISTHNIEFLKYLKRLEQVKKDKKYQTTHLLVECSDNKSQIVPMPKYLVQYQTEYIYLFHQIFKCTNSDYVKENHESSYSFGNSLRKFLEAYLFYKYPGNNDPKEKLRMFFGEDKKSTDLAWRLANEHSHLKEIFDRSMRPVDYLEITKLARYVLQAICNNDRDSYNSLLNAIGEVELSNCADI